MKLDFPPLPTVEDFPIDSGSLFDSHCHFDFDHFGDEQTRRRLWQQCRKQGVRQLLIPGVEPKQWPIIRDLSTQLDGIVWALGIHPWFIANLSPQSVETVLSIDNLELVEHELCVAIGECGLDALIETDMDWQQAVFEMHLKLAAALDKPLVIHVRKAHNAVLALLARYSPRVRGVIHGFTGSAELATQYWRLGFYLGIGGSITYPRARKTRAAVKTLPLEAMLLETDAPDMPLAGYQGQANHPLQVIRVANVLAQLREQPLAEISEQTTRNAQGLFGLSDNFGLCNHV